MAKTEEIKKETESTTEEPLFFSGSEFDDGEKITLLAIARTEQQFRNTETKELITAPMFVLKIQASTGVTGYMKIWGGATPQVAFTQVENYVKSHELKLPATNLNKILTISTGGKGNRQYWYFAELINKLDISKLGI